jgi:hypothetical protein
MPAAKFASRLPARAIAASGLCPRASLIACRNVRGSCAPAANLPIENRRKRPRDRYRRELIESNVLGCYFHRNKVTEWRIRYKTRQTYFLRLMPRLFRDGVQGWESEAIKGGSAGLARRKCAGKHRSPEELGWSQQEGCLILIACFRVFAAVILRPPVAARTVTERRSHSGMGIDLRLPGGKSWNTPSN